MRITEFKGKNIDISDTIRSYVENKIGVVSKLTEKFEPCDLRVEVGKNSKHHKKGEVFLAELTLSIPGTVLRSEVRKDELYAAIDVSINDLRRQVSRYKKKLRDADRVQIDPTMVENEEEF